MKHLKPSLIVVIWRGYRTAEFELKLNTRGDPGASEWVERRMYPHIPDANLILSDHEEDILDEAKRFIQTLTRRDRIRIRSNVNNEPYFYCETIYRCLRDNCKVTADVWFQ